MVKCSFCGHNIEQGTGKMLAKNDGSIFYYCSNKCEKNQIKLGRIPRNIKWTEEFRKTKTTK
ncbi:50S ribosomal protein L24e [Candidatus Woesearchaeota archaeon]|nr:50S ribosomal protein L24e [Candidatus Woesearchaeota archaeon]